MTGSLNMSGNSISYVDNPTRQRDAVNKNYVDNIATTTSASYRGNGAVSWSQLTNHLEQIMRPLATREYVNNLEEYIDNFIVSSKVYVDSLRHKPVIIMRVE